MKKLVTLIVFSLFATPAFAQDVDEDGNINMHADPKILKCGVIGNIII